MNILQATAWYPPHSLGGTEVYLTGLISELREASVGNTVCVPGDTGDVSDYTHDGTSVRRYPVNTKPSGRELLSDSPHQDFQHFTAILKKHREAVYHQHSWTRGCGLPHLKAAHALGMQTVVTVHVPGSICLRGTMMRFGRQACEGAVSPSTCASCWAQSRGVPQFLARLIAAIPFSVASVVRHLPGRLGTLLGARWLAEKKVREYRQLLEYADRVVVVSSWLYDAFRARGAPRNKLLLSRHGIDMKWRHRMLQRFEERDELKGRDCSEEKLRLLFLGRWDPVKGVEVIVKAMRRLPQDLEVELTIHALSGDGKSEQVYETVVRRLAASDQRIHIRQPLARDTLWEQMGQFDVLAIPSQCMETGPLVVLEALSRGLFVIGSDLGGISEWVEEGRGLLVPADDIGAWAKAIQKASARKKERGSLMVPAQPLRSMRDVSAEMKSLYQELQ